MAQMIGINGWHAMAQVFGVTNIPLTTMKLQGNTFPEDNLVSNNVTDIP